MIELEIQGLSENREGLLIEVGRLVMASGFTLQRQRLQQDHHGILLTMVVRGPPRKKRTLEAALDACDRFISVKVFPFVEGEPNPHFAASPKRVGSAAVVPPAVAVASTAAVHAATPMAEDRIRNVEPVAASAPEPPREPPAEPEFEFILPTPRASAPAPAPVVTTPFVELVPLEPDAAAVEKALRELEYDYPQIVPQLLALAHSVAAGARESSLALAGQRAGAWVFAREYALDDGLDLREAIEHIGTPALRALVEVDQQGAQLHIRDSPLCTEDGHSGCSFFSGFLEGLLGPAIAPGGLSIFPVCCRSYGADECVLAISD
ncbi:hypothetical protein ACFPME_04810 [Rhodanobacter umsongensis]|uniref:4-vinyl reductase 4VR domain-containing protein n=1 Tax=Rhodanobacter umsongensis TaxID=633153 RepID=A0ABW0JJF5_9GAMM